MRGLRYLVIWTLITGCGNPPCYVGDHGNYTNHVRSQIVAVSPMYGFSVDDPKGELDLAKLDMTVSAIVECIGSILPLTMSEYQTAECVGQPSSEVRSCIVVKVPEWHVSSCTGSQLFPCSVPVLSCLNKGQTPTLECPCSCRAIIQDNSMILTTPNLELFPARLTELLTGCPQIWNTRLSKCGSTVLVRR